MGSLAPAFLYRNRLGIFCFQRRVPKSFRIANPKLPRFVRRSLATRDRAVALKVARKLSVKFDALAQQFFKSEEGFARGIKLLSEHDDALETCTSYDEFQTKFLDGLDDVTDKESQLLRNAVEYLRARSRVEVPRDAEDRNWIQALIASAVFDS